MFNHFFRRKKALQPNAVAGLERTGRAHCATVRRAYADGRGPLETRMVIVAPGAALDGVCPTTLPVATLSSYTQTVLTWKPAFSSVVWAVSKSLPTTLGTDPLWAPDETTIVTVEPLSALPLAGDWEMTRPSGTLDEGCF